MKYFYKFFVVMIITGSISSMAMAQKRKVPFTVIYNHDGTYMNTCSHPWKKPGQIWQPSMLTASIDELANIGIDVIAFSPGNGVVPWWKSKRYENHWDWYLNRTGKTADDLSPFGKYMYQGGDIVQDFIDACRKNNIMPFISLRLKDEHDITRTDNEWVSKFFLDNQRLRLDLRPEAVFGYRGLNWMYSKVPQERLDIIRELCSYDIDGLELDFQRFPPFFLDELTSDAQRRDIMTEFIREARKIVDNFAHANQKRYLTIRVPNRIKEFKSLGIDLGLLDKESLVDVITISPSFVSQVENDIELFRAWAPDTTVFYEMTHCSARGLDISWGRPGLAGDAYKVLFTTPTRYYTMANLAYNRGADGVQLFNFIYTRPKWNGGLLHGAPYNPGEPPFAAIKHFHDKQWLARQPQLYWINHWWKSGYHGRQFTLPKNFVVDTEEVFQIDIALPAVPVIEGKVRLRNNTGTPSLTWNVWLNNHALQEAEDVSATFNDPYQGFVGQPRNYSAFRFDPQIIKEGLNSIRVKLTEGPVSGQFSTDLIYIDLALITE